RERQQRADDQRRAQRGRGEPRQRERQLRHRVRSRLERERLPQQRRARQHRRQRRRRLGDEHERRGARVLMKRAPGTATALLLLLGSFGSGPLAVTYYLATDVPATLGGALHATNEILRSDDGAYALEITLGVPIRALHRRADGVWLFTPADPAK